MQAGRLRSQWKNERLRSQWQEGEALMKRLSLTLTAVLAAAVLSLGPPATGAEPALKKKPMTVHDFKVKTIDGKDYDLKKLAGKVLMVVNVASQ